MSKDYPQIGRKTPSNVGRQALRTWVHKGTLFAISAALALAPSHKSQADEGVNPEVEAEIAAFEAAFEGLDVVNISTTRYSTAQGDVPLDVDPVQAFGQDYFEEDLEGIEAELRKAFDAAGTFDMRPRKQFVHTGVYFGGIFPSADADINDILAKRTTSLYEGELSTPSSSVAFAYPLNFGEDDPRTVCATLFLSHTVDKQALMNELSAGRSLTDTELETLYLFVANHELAHCVNSGHGVPVWLNESLADGYGLAWVLQNKGPAEFSKLARDILHGRQLNAIEGKDVGHYTTPALEKFIPKLLEAHANGALEGLDPRELRDLSFTLMLGDSPENVAQTFQNLQRETRQTEFVFSNFSTFLQADETGNLTIAHTAPPESHTFLQNLIERQAAAVAVFGPPQRVLNQQAVNTPEATQRYRENLAEYVQNHPKNIALEGVRYQLWNMQQAEHLALTAVGEEAVETLHQTADYSGLTFAYKREILQDFEQHLEQDYGQTQGMTAGIDR